MRNDEVILKRQVVRTMFRNGDMDFMFNWCIGVADLLGMGPSLALATARRVRDGKPGSWREEFDAAAGRLLDRARSAEGDGDAKEAVADLLFGAAYAYRAALQLESPNSPAFATRADAMEEAFAQAIAKSGAPVRAIEVPFEGSSLQGYFLHHGDGSRPLMVMVGGGDTFREDLWYFGGLAARAHGWDALMVDLPGQGRTPERGLTFREDMGGAVSIAIDWALGRMERPEAIALYGVSGGGWFSAQAAASDRRIDAWIAATPIFDMAEVFRREFGAALKAPSFLLDLVARIAGGVNETARINLEKYCWQFGAATFADCVAGAIERSRAVDLDSIRCPSLFLVGEGEGEELKRQARLTAENLSRRGVPVRTRYFTAAEGADGHCQVNNLRLAQQVIFGWLEERLAAVRRRTTT